jgi:hypothetical protein
VITVQNITEREVVKMNGKKVVFFMVALILTGCLPSLHPLYTDEDVIFEEKLVGKWAEEGGNIWEFRQGDGKTYRMRVFDGKEGRLKAHLVKLQDMLFLDIFPEDETLEELQDFYKVHLLPVHTFMKVEQLEPMLVLRMMKSEKVAEMLESDPNLLKHETIEHPSSSIVLTASTKELQQFMIEHGNEEGMFKNAMELTRRDPLYTEEDVIFDENLIGRWEGKEGEILDSIRMGERAYDMVYIPNDGNADIEYRVAAFLIRLRGTLFLGGFFDISSLDDADSHGRHLVPDFFAKVDQIEPELVLWSIDYKEVAEWLKEDCGPLETADPKAHPVFKGTRADG